MLGTYQYPDFPMDTETFGVKPGQHIPGQIVHRYLETYARHFDIYDKIRFEHKVETAEHQDNGGWILTEYFGAPIFHGKDLRSHEDTYGTAKSVTVSEGTKSAWDMVYLYATKGIQVNWVIRGKIRPWPRWECTPLMSQPFKKWLEKLAHIRMLTWFSPCSWGAADGYVKTRNFYHGTFIGRAIVDKFWSILGNDVITLNKYDSHPETAKLKPWSNAMFVATSIGILNYEKDFFEVVKEGLVKILFADIERLSTQTVHLSDGTALPIRMCCAVSTGWKHVPPIRLLPEGIAEDIGMPHTPSPNSFPYASLLDQVDKEIFDKFPRLKDQPIQKVQNSKYHTLLEDKGLSSNDTITPSTDLTPYTLYTSSSRRQAIGALSETMPEVIDFTDSSPVQRQTRSSTQALSSTTTSSKKDQTTDASSHKPKIETLSSKLSLSSLGLSEEHHDALILKRNWLTSHTIPIPRDAFRTFISSPKGYHTVAATFVFAQPEAGTAIDKAELPHRPFPYARIATSPPKFNTKLLCIGHPGSEDLEAERSGVKTEYDTLVLTEGTFRGLNKNQDPQDNSEIGALKHSCWTYWGHSGAGLFDRKTGALVGVHSSWDDKTRMRRGVPLEAVVAFVEEVESSKREDFTEEWQCSNIMSNSYQPPAYALMQGNVHKIRLTKILAPLALTL
ncbi:hypothetical protein ACKAV7_012386, partial [Fusarium commune]